MPPKYTERLAASADQGRKKTDYTVSKIDEKNEKAFKAAERKYKLGLSDEEPKRPGKTPLDEWAETVQ